MAWARSVPTTLSVLIRGSAGGRLPFIAVAAVLGAWAGDAIGDRIGIDVLTIGDYHLIGASVLAWVGIGIASVVAVLGLLAGACRVPGEWIPGTGRPPKASRVHVVAPANRSQAPASGEVATNVTDERTTQRFLRGLTIGALLGAIIAGSRIWARWRR